MLKVVAIVLTGLAIFAGFTAAQASIIFAFEYIAPTVNCQDQQGFTDANLKIEFEFTDSVLTLGGATINAADSAFVGWSIASSAGDGFSISGNTFLRNTLAEIEFTFDLGVHHITGLADTKIMARRFRIIYT